MSTKETKETCKGVERKLTGRTWHKRMHRKRFCKERLEFDYQNKSMWKHTTDKQKPFFNIIGWEIWERKLSQSL